MKTNAINLAYRKNNIQAINTMIDNTIDAFKDKYGSRIVAMESEVNARILTTAQMLNEIKKYMISFEIERNGIAQAVMSSLNNEAKTAEKVASANFIMSTVHSAKGLEFDNVIVLYDSESESKMDEATKRMYYVALTRAKKTEYVYAYDTLARPKIGRDYETIVAGLKAAQTAAGNGTVDDDIDDADTEDTSELEALLAMDPNPAKNGYDDESGDENDDDDV
jgi:DNA helicase-2/ATP-dependent DNA helicase PcrA